MDVETLGKLHGYIQWGADVYWNKQEHDIHKREVFAILQEHKDAGYVGNAMTIQELKSIINGKQLPFHATKQHISIDIKDTFEDLAPLFQNMHVGLFVTDVLLSVTRLHQNTVALHDSLQRQAKLLHAVNAQTCEDLLPHVFFLYGREQQFHRQNQQHVHDIYAKTLRVLRHLNKNYFTTLKHLASDKKYREDHHDLFVSAYVLSLCTRALTQEYGIPSQDLASVEEAFIGNVAPYK